MKKMFVGIVGATMMLALSGCNASAPASTAEEFLPVAAEEFRTEETSPVATEEFLTEETSPVAEQFRTEETLPEQARFVNAPAIEDAPTVSPEETTVPTNEQRTDESNETDAVNRDSQETARRRYFIVPEGYEIATPPTQVEIGVANGTEIPLVVSGNEIIFNGQRPVMHNNEVFVPIFGVFENLALPSNWPTNISAYTVSWDEQTATIRNSVKIITLTRGESTLTGMYAGETQPMIFPLTSPVQKINGEWMMPLMPVAEAIMACVIWDDEKLHLFFSRSIFGGMNADGDMISVRPISPYI
ncbi:MAG: stalk domain-containing protein [Defluviitaleaceae bacterium]|nr:stalk domain-containing protein [Defluviitaleaceae bacterium]